jgi:hypothetical protein
MTEKMTTRKRVTPSKYEDFVTPVKNDVSELVPVKKIE